MTKKHFIALADHIRTRQALGIDKYSQSQLIHLADFCEAHYPRFNRARWLGYIAGTNGKHGGAA